MQNSIEKIYISKNHIIIIQNSFNSYQYLNKPIIISCKYFDCPQSIIRSFTIAASQFYYDEHVFCTEMGNFALKSPEDEKSGTPTRSGLVEFMSIRL